MNEQLEDDFWAAARAQDAAARGQHADPGACGTCRDRVANGGQVKHDECAQRATLLHAPDHPGYELITGMTEEEVWALPPRFHVPVYMESSTPKTWVCAVCWGDGWSTLWPCKTATDQGLRVFTADDHAETWAKKQAAELQQLRKDRDAFRDQRNTAFETNRRLLGEAEAAKQARLHAENETRTQAREHREAAARAQKEIEQLRARVTELEGHAVQAETERHKPGGDADQALITYATSTRTITADSLTPYIRDVRADAMYEEWQRYRPIREERSQLRAEVKQWRTTYGTDALPGVRAQMEHLRARITELEAEVTAERERYTAGLRRADEHVNAMSEELKRYADGEEQPVLWSVYNAMHSRAATAEGRVAELERELKKYVGAEPTIAEEMAYLSRCIDAVLDLCTRAEEQAGRWEQPLPVPEWVAEVRQAAEGLVERTTYPPALPWAHLMDTDDLADFLRDLDTAMRDAARQAHFAGRPQAPAILAALEYVCASHRATAEAQHAHNTAAGPAAIETGEGR